MFTLLKYEVYIKYIKSILRKNLKNFRCVNELYNYIGYQNLRAKPAENVVPGLLALII